MANERPGRNPQAAAFVAAIRDEPDDDTHRLVYADWLEEHGEPSYARFIRLQVESARLAQDDPRRAELVQEEANLRQAHYLNWLGNFDRWPEMGRWYQCNRNSDYLYWGPFTRGFVEVLSNAVARTLIERGEDIMSCQPIRSVHLLHTDREEGDPKLLVDCPVLAHLRELTLTCNRAEDMRILGESPLCVRLERLSLKASRAAIQDVLQALADSTLFGRLRHLNLSHNRMGRRALHALFSSPRFRLTHLYLCGSYRPGYNDHAMNWEQTELFPNCGPAGVHVVAHAFAARSLEVLDLRVNNLTAAAVQALVRSPHLENLRELRIMESPEILPALAPVLRERFGDRVKIESVPWF